MVRTQVVLKETYGYSRLLVVLQSDRVRKMNKQTNIRKMAFMNKFIFGAVSCFLNMTILLLNAACIHIVKRLLRAEFRISAGDFGDAV